MHLDGWGEREHKALAIAIVLLGRLPRGGGVAAKDGPAAVPDEQDDRVRAGALCKEGLQTDAVAHGGVHGLPVTRVVADGEVGVQRGDKLRAGNDCRGGGHARDVGRLSSSAPRAARWRGRGCWGGN